MKRFILFSTWCSNLISVPDSLTRNLQFRESNVDSVANPMDSTSSFSEEFFRRIRETDSDKWVRESFVESLIKRIDS